MNNNLWFMKQRCRDTTNNLILIFNLGGLIMQHRINALTTRINSMNASSVINSNTNIGGLNAQLTSVTQNANQKSQANASLASQLAQLRVQLTEKNAECASLERQKQSNQDMVSKIQSYLSDFQDLNNDSNIFYEELEQSLVGNLTQLSVEEIS